MTYEIVKIRKHYVKVKSKDKGTINVKKSTIEKAKKKVKDDKKKIFRTKYTKNMPSKPKIHKVVRYKVKKNGHTSMFCTKSAAKKKAQGTVRKKKRIV